jgi:hypothetical protein
MPDYLPGPSLSMSEEDIKLGAYTYEQSLSFLIEHFPNSKIGVVYIPSPLSSYHLISPEVRNVPRFPGVPAKEFPTEMVEQRSQLIFHYISETGQKLGVPYLDLRPLVRKATEHDIIHGPVNWVHFNKKGYEVLAQGVTQLIAQFENPN